MAHNGFGAVYQTLEFNEADAITKLFPGFH